MLVWENLEKSVIYHQCPILKGNMWGKCAWNIFIISTTHFYLFLLVANKVLN